MRSDDSRLPMPARGHPLVQILVSFPIAFFTGALVTDVVYANTANVMWADFSDWMLAAGMALGVLAAIVGLIDLIAHRRTRTWRRVWPLAIGCVIVLVVALFNNFVHSRDAWTSVVPTGLTLSAVTVVLMLIVAWFGFARSVTHYADPVDTTYAEVRP